MPTLYKQTTYLKRLRRVYGKKLKNKPERFTDKIKVRLLKIKITLGG